MMISVAMDHVTITYQVLVQKTVRKVKTYFSGWNKHQQVNNGGRQSGQLLGERVHGSPTVMRTETRWCEVSQLGTLRENKLQAARCNCMIDGGGG